MQRVRIGITGLAVVFLLVLLTAALLGTLRRQGTTSQTIAAAAAGNGQDAPKEPLAELGVAPGASPSAAAPAITAPPPTPLLTPAAPVVRRSPRTAQ